MIFGYDQTPYWLFRGMAARLEKQECDHQTDTDCNQADLCVTEWCLPCAASAWMDETREAEKLPLPEDPTPNEST